MTQKQGRFQIEHKHKKHSTKAEVDQHTTQHKKDITTYCARNLFPIFFCYAAFF